MLGTHDAPATASERHSNVAEGDREGHVRLVINAQASAWQAVASEDKNGSTRREVR